MWLLETLFIRVLQEFAKILSSIGVIGVLIVGNIEDYNETILNIFMGVLIAGLICFGAIALAITINLWFFKELN